MATYRPLLTPPPFRCGHAHTPANTVVAGRGADYCRACLVAGVRRLHPPVLLGDRVVAVLAAHPGGLRIDQLRAQLGYRQSRRAIHLAVWRLRRRRGVPIAAVRQGNRSWYVLRQEGV